MDLPWRECGNNFQVSLLWFSLLVTVIQLRGAAFTVDLKLQNAGESSHSDKLSPETTVTINCTFDLTLADTKIVTLLNGSSKTVYYYQYESGLGEPGPDFDTSVSSPRYDKGGWFSIDFTLPRCYRNNMFKCTVFNKELSTGESIKYFSVARISQPFISCETCSWEPQGEVPVEGGHSFVCDVFLVTPEINIVWEPSACVKKISGSDISTEDSSLCVYNQTSKVSVDLQSAATCLRSESRFTLKCIARSTLGFADRTAEITMKTNSGTETQGVFSMWLLLSCAVVTYFFQQRSRGPESP